MQEPEIAPEKQLKQKDFEIISLSLHHIDIKNERIYGANKELEGTDIKTYIDELIPKILKKGDSRRYTNSSDHSRVFSIINKVIASPSIHAELSNEVAKSLLRVEIDTQASIRQIRNVKKGSLIQALIKRYGKFEYLITKVEHDAFIDDEDFKWHFGLPEEKTILKTVLYRFNTAKLIDSIILTDTNAKISKYWWFSFLELNQARTDEDNTNITFKEIDKLISFNIKKKSKRDGFVLRNALIGYFKSNESFSFEGISDSVFKNYTPEDIEEKDYKSFVSKLDKLATSEKFDNSFEICQAEIKDKIKKEYSISDKLSLSINGAITRNAIKSDYDINGAKILKIKVDNDDTFNAFK